MGPATVVREDFLYIEFVSNIAEFRQASNLARWRVIEAKAASMASATAKTTPGSMRARRIGATAAFTRPRNPD